MVLGFYMNGRWNNDVYPIPVKASQIRQPVRSFTFIDEEETLLTGGVFGLREGQESFWWTVPATRDRGGGANRAFAGGQGEFHEWKWPHRIRRSAETRVVNDLDRADLLWLLSRVPGARWGCLAEAARRDEPHRTQRFLPGVVGNSGLPGQRIILGAEATFRSLPSRNGDRSQTQPRCLRAASARTTGNRSN